MKQQLFPYSSPTAPVKASVILLFASLAAVSVDPQQFSVPAPTQTPAHRGKHTEMDTVLV